MQQVSPRSERIASVARMTVISEKRNPRATRTATPCPAWCTEPKGHGYDLDGDEACAREHACTVATWGLNYIRITADGQAEFNGAPETVSKPRIDVVIDPPDDLTTYLDGLTVEGARQLGAQLLVAADRMEAAL